MKRGRDRTRRAAGFLLLDMLLAIVVIAILAAVAVPALRPNDSLKIISAATVLAADLDYAQALSLDTPGDPAVVRIDKADGRYWLARVSNPDVPIDRPTGGAYEVTFGEGAAEYLDGIGIALEGGDGEAITFDAFGRLTQTDDAMVVLSSPSGELTVKVSATTGSVFIGK